MSPTLGRTLRLLPVLLVLLLTSWPVAAQTVEQTLVDLQEQGEREGWTFTTGPSEASFRTLDELCGFVPLLDPPPGGEPRLHTPPLGLPAAYDWRNEGGMTAIRDQGSCGSCWAFATVAPLESAILIRDGVTVDLSEQWLVSCNNDGYGCTDGGWFAHDYHQWKTDDCDGTGAVLEADFPYVASNAPCSCPYNHPYEIANWAYVGPTTDVAAIDDIKAAILEYGPVSVAVYVDTAFQNYSGGVYNSCPDPVPAPNHAVVLVGWDDTQGTSGVWILRNSWGTSWGDAGYMYIEYGCSNVGYAACYIEYEGANAGLIEVTPTEMNLGTVAAGSSTTQTFTIRNIGSTTANGNAAGLMPPFSFADSASYTLAVGESQNITVRFAPTAAGDFTDAVLFAAGTPVLATVSGTATGGTPTDSRGSAPLVSDGTYTGTNMGATTDGSSTCGGEADVWWRFKAPHTGATEIDTCGSDFDTVLSVHGVVGGIQLACNDDYAGCATNPGGSRVAFNVIAGAQYLVRVAGRSGATGNIVLSIETTGLPRTISGMVTTNNGFPVAGVTLAGLPGSPVTNSYGQYSVEVPDGFTGVGTPTRAGVTFSPASRTYVDLADDSTSQDYTTASGTYTISGQVLDGSSDPVAGVRLNGLPGTPVTGSTGTYSATVAAGFTGTVTPSRNATDFAPTSRGYTNVVANQANQDYTATRHTGGLRVNLGPADAVTAGALWCVDGGAWYDSGETATGVDVGQHAISFASVIGWTAPLPHVVTVQENVTSAFDATYVQYYYALTLTADPEDTGTIVATTAPDDGDYYLQDTEVAMTAAPAPGYRVRAWHSADVAPAAGVTTNTVTMTSDRTVTVEFEPQPFHHYILTATVAGGEGTVSPARGAYRAGQPVTVTATPAAGYEVSAWSGTDDDASTATTNTVTMLTSQDVTVTFALSGSTAQVVEPPTGMVWTPAEEMPADETEPPIEEEIDEDELAVLQSAPGLGVCGLGVVEMMMVSLLGLAALRWSAGGRGR
ncbi:MAG: C1 family peptidase [Phycisphaerae bacterium]